MKKILFTLFAIFTASAAQAQTIKVMGAAYDRGCVQEALADACKPTGQEFASDLVRVHTVGSRVGECVVAEIAHCASVSEAASQEAPSSGGSGQRRGRRR